MRLQTTPIQFYGFCRPSEADALSRRMSNCSDDVSAWMKVNRLQLNTSKTEVLWCSSARRQHQIPTNPVRIGNTSVLPVSSARDLGVYLDADVTMRCHVTAVVRSCFAALRQIRRVRRSLPRHALLTLIRALVVSKVDFCCSVLAGTSAYLEHGSGVSKACRGRERRTLRICAWSPPEQTTMSCLTPKSGDTG